MSFHEKTQKYLEFGFRSIDLIHKIVFDCVEENWDQLRSEIGANSREGQAKVH